LQVSVPLTGCVACQNVPVTAWLAGKLETLTLPLTGWVAGRLVMKTPPSKFDTLT